MSSIRISDNPLVIALRDRIERLDQASRDEIKKLANDANCDEEGAYERLRKETDRLLARIEDHVVNVVEKSFDGSGLVSPVVLAVREYFDHVDVDYIALALIREFADD